MIEVSVEITTYNRKIVLERALRLLAEQSFPAESFEVVLSDDGSSDGLVELVESIAGDLPYAIRILRHDHQGPGHAHNCGIRACRGDLVIMLAADILPTADLVAEHVRSHRAHPEASVAVSGALEQSPDLPDTVLQRSFDALVNQIFTGETEDQKHGGFLVSNVSFKKAFMLDHGMFREWPPAAGEDLELGYRLRKNGMTIIRNPRALGHHHHEVSIEGIARRGYMTGYHTHYLIEHVPEPWTRRIAGETGIGDGVGAWLRQLVRKAGRGLLSNGVTVPLLVVPLLRRSERSAIAARLVPALQGRLVSYAFHRGLSDHRAGRPFDPGRARL